MPVEVLRGAGYDMHADWWSLGIVVFKMLFGYPPFLSGTRLETKHKVQTLLVRDPPEDAADGSLQILNWPQYLRFPASTQVSREAQDFVAALICEPADRLGARLTSNQGNSASRTEHQTPLSSLQSDIEPTSMMDDGSEIIKGHAWFRDIKWSSLHLQTPPFKPELAHETDTRYFEDHIPAEPLLAPELAQGVPAPLAVHDPLLRHPREGPHLLEVRKQYAFKGWTFKKPKDPIYDPRDGWRADILGGAGGRGRPSERNTGPGSSFSRSLSV